MTTPQVATVYRGSVKDLKGPVSVGAAGQPGLVFDYGDSYSVFDWGRMPDALAHKGEAMAVLAASVFEQLESPDTWKAFSRTREALELRKGNRFGAAFNELGEKLQSEGLRTHFQGAVVGTEWEASGVVQAQALSQVHAPFRRIAVRAARVIKPFETRVLGRTLYDYSPQYELEATQDLRLIPLEVVFRFSCPEGSSLRGRIAQNANYLVDRGFGDVNPDQVQGFPVVELFTKLEPSDRELTLFEALCVSGVRGSELQDVIFRSAWVAGFLRWRCGALGLELADGKFEWAWSRESGGPVLVDAIGPDELRILKDGVQLSKEFLRHAYKKTSWYGHLERAKNLAKNQGQTDWKRWVAEGPPALKAQDREVAEQIYLSLANQLTGRRWFEHAWTVEQVCARLKDYV